MKPCASRSSSPLSSSLALPEKSLIPIRIKYAGSGRISYPLYMVHYPFIYLYYAWVKNGDLSFSESLPGALAVVIGSILLAWLCLKFYDEPVRSFLAKHFLKRKNNRSLEPSSSVLQKKTDG